MRTRKRDDGIRVYCCGSGRVRGCHGNHIKESILAAQIYSTLQTYFMFPDSKDLLMMELGMIRETKEEANLMIRSIGDGITKLARETILGVDWLQKYVESISIEFTHTRRGRKEFSTPVVAKYSLLQPKVQPVVLRTVK